MSAPSEFTAKVAMEGGPWKVVYRHPARRYKGTAASIFRNTDEGKAAADEFAKRLTMPLPDPDAPLSHAVATDPTERDGEMVPTWEVRGDNDMGDDERDRLEWQAIDRESDIDWNDLGLHPKRTYLVRRKAEATR